LDSEREAHLWEQRAAGYVDAITALRHRQQVRETRWNAVLPFDGTPLPWSDDEDPMSLADWSVLEARSG
jgi:hypothetical protein